MSYLVRAQDLHAPDINNEDEKIMIDEMQRLNSKFGLSVQLWLWNSGKIKADFEKGIIVDMKSLANYKNMLNNTNYFTAVRLILAHEFAHFLQYKKYKQELTDISLMSSIIYECQADIIAGKYCNESIAESMVEKKVKAYQDKVPLEKVDSLVILEKTFNLDALKLFYQIGAHENETSDHPFNEQRLLAVKLGIEAGKLYMLDLASQKYDNILSREDMKSILSKRSALAFNSKLTDPYNFDSIMYWSLWQAKRVIHYNFEATKNLIISWNPEIKWDTSSDNPYVYYEYSLLNTGNKTMICDFQVRCDAVLRNNPDSNIYSGFLQSRDYSIELLPKQHKLIKDKLNWTYWDKKYMPRMISPSDPTSLLSCRFEGDNELLTNNSNPNYRKQFTDVDEQPEQRSIPIYLILLLQDTSHFWNFVQNPGEGYLDDEGNQDKNMPIIYKCFNPLSKIELNIPTDSSEKPYVEFGIYKGVNKEYALLLHNNLLFQIQKSIDRIQLKFEDLYGDQLKVTSLIHPDYKGKKIQIITRLLKTKTRQTYYTDINVSE